MVPKHKKTKLSMCKFFYSLYLLSTKYYRKKTSLIPLNDFERAKKEAGNEYSLIKSSLIFA